METLLMVYSMRLHFGESFCQTPLVQSPAHNYCRMVVIAY